MNWIETHASVISQDRLKQTWIVHWDKDASQKSGNPSRVLPTSFSFSTLGPMGIYQPPDDDSLFIRSDHGLIVIIAGHIINFKEGPNSYPYIPLTDAASWILDNYHQHGIQVITQLRGLFSIILWDAQEQKLFAFRDPLGFFPLFYYQDQTGLRFSNSIDALLSCQDVSAEINRVAIVNILCHLWPEPDETYYTRIKKVIQAHYLSYSHDQLTQIQYWDPNPPGTPRASMTQEEALRFDDYFERTIQNFLSLGNAGIFLSGGLDSVSIAAFAKDISIKHQLSTPLALSIAFPHPDCNEEERQRNVAKVLGLEQFVLPFDQAVSPNGLISDALDLSATWPAPIQNPWRPAYFNLARIGRELGCRTILTGIGGDDWLTVNPAYIADLLRQGKFSQIYQFTRAFLKSYSLSKLAMLRYSLWNSGVKPLVTSYARRGVHLIAPDWLYQTRFNRQLHKYALPDEYAPDPQLRKAVQESIHRRIEKNLSRSEPRGPFGFHNANAMSYTFSQASVSMELEEEYEVGRKLGIHVLHPYWDANFIEFLCQIPPNFLIQGGREKGLVRQSMARRFPELGFERQRKVSASNFYLEILLKEGKKAWGKLDGLNILTKIGVIKRDFADNLLDSTLKSSDLYVTHKLWEFMNMEIWLRSKL